MTRLYPIYPHDPGLTLEEVDERWPLATVYADHQLPEIHAAEAETRFIATWSGHGYNRLRCVWYDPSRENAERRRRPWKWQPEVPPPSAYYAKAVWWPQHLVWVRFTIGISSKR